MELFPDRAHVRLRSAAHGTLLHADDDGWGVSLTPRRESPNTAWRVHRLVLGGDEYVLLRAASNGRYLAVCLDSAPRGCRGRRVVQSLYGTPGQDDVLWEAVDVGDHVVLMRHVSNHFLRANGTHRRWSSFVSADNVNNQSRLMLWKIEAIPPRLAPRELPPRNPLGAPGMELFPDRLHVRLKSDGCGLFLHADEDGWGISMSARRASLSTAWQLHRIRRDGNNYVLLLSAAYGRYLTLWHRASSGYRLTQGIYVSSGQTDVLWVAISAGTGGKIRLRHGHHVSYHLNGVADGGAGRRRDRLWTVQMIPPRPEPPVLPPPRLVPAGSHGFRRRILYTRMDYSGDYVPNSFGTFEFQGRSSSDLRATLAKLLNKEICTNITLCICPGSKGRLTPLVVDLPSNEEPIAIVVMITGSPAALILRHPDVDAA